jgi:hypothetical protein
MIDELISTALLGTRHGGGRTPALPDDLASALPKDATDNEGKFLDSAAALMLYVKAGVRARDGILPPPQAGVDRWNECSPGAAAVLTQICDEAMQPLLLEWLELAANAAFRPPHRMLPQLLDAAAARRALRTAVSRVIDERGRWLTQFNPNWQFNGAGDQGPIEQWQLGNRQQRAEALRAVRNSDPERAHELIASTWSEDAAELRAEWVGCLLVNLGDADEPFLEACFNDRSARVREAAADLACRLPESRFSQRMSARVSPLVTFQAGVEGSVLKFARGKKASWKVTLPEAFDKAMLHDGMLEKPAQGVGPKQWWLQQIIGFLPLQHWTRTYDSSAGELVAAARGEFAAVLTRGWLAALSRRPVVEWIDPLFDVAGPDIFQSPRVLQAVPPETRAKVVKEFSGRVGQNAVLLNQLFDAWRPLDQATSAQLLDSFDLGTLLMSEAHFALHHATVRRWEHMLSSWDKTGDHQRRVDQVLTVLALRRALHQELHDD